MPLLEVVELLLPLLPLLLLLLFVLQLLCVPLPSSCCAAAQQSHRMPCIPTGRHSVVLLLLHATAAQST